MAFAHPIQIFIPIITLFFVLGIVTPIINIALGETNLTSTSTNLETILNGSSYLTIGLNLVTGMFWTFGLPSFINYILIIPRIISLIALYYIIFPTK